MAPVTLRPPTFSNAKTPADYKSPNIPWMSEQWHVTHSTLPMWKSKRNVCIQYTPLDPSTSSITKENTDRLDDLVTYQSLNSEKLSTVHGMNKLAGSGDGRGEWDWRGRGWLKIAGSHWEILGWGEEGQTGNKWMVICFAKTLFTPAGIDIFSRDKLGLQEETVTDIRKALEEIDDQDIKKMSPEIFEVKIDDARKD